MGLNLSGLGSLADGMSRGLERGAVINERNERMRMLREDADFQNEERVRKRKTWADADRLRQIDEDFGRFVSEGDPKQAGLASLTLPSSSSGAPAAQPGGPGLGDVAGQRATLPSLTPDRLYDGMRRRTHALAVAGLHDQWKTSIVYTEKFGRDLRTKALGPALAKLDAGDPDELVKVYNRFVDDGNEMDVMSKGTGPNGQPIFTLRQRNLDTGAERTTEVDLPRFAQMAQAIQDPAAALKSSLARYGKIFETNEGIRKDKAHVEAVGAQSRETNNQRHQHELAQIQARGALAMREIGARVAGEKSVADYKKTIDNQPTPKDQLAAIDQLRKQLRDSQATLLKEWELMGKDSSDEQRAELKSAYLEQKRRLDDTDADLGRQRERVAQRLNLRDGRQPAAGAVTALPEGARQIGTSRGKPVYQTPDGKRYVAE